jgi:DNA processing protein
MEDMIAGHTISNDRLDYLRLALVPGVGPRTLAALLEFFGSPAEVLRASLSRLGEVERVGPKIATAIRDASQSEFAAQVVKKCEEQRVTILMPGDAEFPRLLHELADPPPVLFMRGSLTRTDQLAVAVVGTRHPTLYGRQVAESISRGLAKAGFTIVSGLARGIDAVAHRAAIDAGGRTIALLGSCVTDIYPPEHVSLAEDVIEHGAILSETDPFAKPKAGVFPQRNRLISGLSLGVIVVEAAERSGALITAQHAGEQGRDIFAIPGPVNSRVSRGCNRLIRDGAILVQDAQDVIEHLGPLVEAADVADDRVIHHPAELQLNDQETAVLQAIQSVPTDLDTIVQQSQLPVSRVLSTISVLEIRGMIRRSGGRSVLRT